MQPLYHHCRAQETKLSVTVELCKKARCRWSKKSLTELLEMIKRISRPRTDQSGLASVVSY